MFLAVQELERRQIRFEQTFEPGEIPLGDRDWKQTGEIWASGAADLLDHRDSRTIRVRGRIRGAVESSCARCLEPVEVTFGADFDLFYYPMSVIARNEETPISRDDTDIGFYEEPGLDLSQVVGEQVVLWLPMRSLCREDCKGLCPRCGINRNQKQCSCEEEFLDPRWDALRHLRGRTRS